MQRSQPVCSDRRTEPQITSSTCERAATAQTKSTGCTEEEKPSWKLRSRELWASVGSASCVPQTLTLTLGRASSAQTFVWTHAVVKGWIPMCVCECECEGWFETKRNVRAQNNLLKPLCQRRPTTSRSQTRAILTLHTHTLLNSKNGQSSSLCLHAHPRGHVCNLAEGLLSALASYFPSSLFSSVCGSSLIGPCRNRRGLYLGLSWRRA